MNIFQKVSPGWLGLSVYPIVIKLKSIFDLEFDLHRLPTMLSFQRQTEILFVKIVEERLFA